MRIPRATPEARALVYNTMKSYLFDTDTPVSSETLANRTRLQPGVVVACLDALVDANVVIQLNAIQGHPMYTLPARVTGEGYGRINGCIGATNRC